MREAAGSAAVHDGGPVHCQSMTFLLLYALASAGGVIAYAPFLSLLLPVQMTAAAGASHVEWLSLSTFCGAASAGISNIVFGWASDRFASRRSWVTAGLILTFVSYALMASVETPAALVAAIILYQATLNMMLGPLSAWAADTVPDHQKGLLGGLLSAGPVMGALAGVLVTTRGMPAGDARLLATCLMFGSFVTPVLLFGKQCFAREGHVDLRPTAGGSRAELLALWSARLVVQIASSVLFAFLFYFFSSLPGDRPEAHQIALLPLATEALAVPLTFILGRWSDRVRTRRPFLMGAALTASAGLALMAWENGLALVVFGYFLASTSITTFAALHIITAMQKLPSPNRRGRDLGIFNLTNTIPAMISPALAFWIVPRHGFAPLMAALSVMVFATALLLLITRPRRLVTIS